MDAHDTRRGAAGSKRYLKPASTLALGFLGIILAGAALLTLPQAAKSRQSVGWLTALFTATSATCVTGLTVVDTYTAFSLFGQIVIICLIQVGGLGFMLFATTALVALGRRITLHNRMLLRETMSMPGLSGGVRTALRFMLTAFLVELAGMLLLALRFVPMYGVAGGLYYSLFHAVSAFCNAGFDLFCQAGSLTQFGSDPHVLLTISGLIIIGGIGFAVINDVFTARFKWRAFALHTKVVLAATTLLLLGGMVMFAVIEWGNAGTLAAGGSAWGDRLLGAWFQSVTTRTAGFYSYNQAQMTDASKMVSTVLMLIGASPASTGGGVKTSTLFVVMVILVSVLRGREDYEAFGRRLPKQIARTAHTVLFIYIMLMVLGAIALSLLEQGRFSMVDLLFEEASALGTVGLSALGTQNLGSGSRLILILFMYSGRVGPLTMMLTFSKDDKKPDLIHYPEEGVLIG